MKKIFKNKKGITLVALIITIIIMLILAGVAISVVVDADGLFAKTRNAANIYELEADNENKTITNLMNYIYQYINDDLGNKKEKINVAVNSSNEISVTVPENLENIVKYEYYISDELQLETDQNTYTNSNLEPNTNYTVYVVMTDSNGQKYYSETVKVKTKSRTYLYQGSRETDDECIEITGGWEGVGVTDIVSNDGTITYTAYAPTLTRNASSIYAKHYLSGKMTTGALTTANKIDVSNYEKLKVDLAAYTTKYCWVEVLVNSEKNKYYTKLGQERIAYNWDTSVTFSRNIVEIDLSHIDQEVYIQINYLKNNTASGTYYAESTLYNAWLE